MDQLLSSGEDDDYDGGEDDGENDDDNVDGGEDDDNDDYDYNDLLN